MKQVMTIMQQVSVLGANDSELPDLQKVLTSLQAGELSPTDAVVKAMGIRDSKMDYH